MAEIDQTEQPQLDLGASPDMAEMPPDMAGGMPPDMAGGEPEFDLDSLLSDIDGSFPQESGMPPQQSQAGPVGGPRGPQEMADAMRAAREAMDSLDQEESLDGTTKRFNELEGKLTRIEEERNALRAEKVSQQRNGSSGEGADTDWEHAG